MSNFRKLVVVASMVAVLSGSSVAQASHTRSIVDRRQHPNGTFFIQSNHARHCVQSRVVRPVRSARPLVRLFRGR